MIRPTVGRVVHYWSVYPPLEGAQPVPALIVHVLDDRLVNVGGFDMQGRPFSAVRVRLLQDDDAGPGPCVTWMDYQKGQAARTEALEAELAKRGGAT